MWTTATKAFQRRRKPSAGMLSSNLTNGFSALTTIPMCRSSGASRVSLAGYDYAGRVRGPSGIFPAPYCSGFGYWLSMKAMKAIADAPLNGGDCEDR